MKNIILLFAFLLVANIADAQSVIQRNKTKDNVETKRSNSTNRTSSTSYKQSQNIHKKNNNPVIETTQSVDLGLPSGTIWAGYNIGANSPEEYGGYYCWGETKTKTEYTEYNYFDTDFSGNPDYLSIYHIKFKESQGSYYSIVGTEYDAATSNWGLPWRMPTFQQMEELICHCKMRWIKYKGVSGVSLTGPNGKSIFLPASGCIGGQGGQNNMDKNKIGMYLLGELKYFDGRFIFYEDFYVKGKAVADKANCCRESGQSVRAVR